MAVESIAIALHHSRAKGATKLVLIGIANHDGDGGAWPSLATLATYAGITPDNVRKAVRRLQELNEIDRLVQEGGTARMPEHMRPNRYLFKLKCPSDCDGSMNHRPRSVLFQLTPPIGSAVPHLADSARDGWGASAAMPEPVVKPPTNRYKDTHVPKRARDPLVYIDHLGDSGRPCKGELLPGTHYCAFGHIVTTD